MLQWLKKSMFRISYEDVSFDKLGYEDCNPDVRSHLEKVLCVFIDGFDLALETQDYKLLRRKLERKFDDHHKGFAFEGAAMYLAMLDLLTPWKAGRLRAFMDNAAQKHDFIITVGAGFAVARVPWGLSNLDSFMRKLEPRLAWCVPDGYGFHQGFFHHQRFIEQCQEPPSILPNYARQLFDSGIGRSMWWVKGASPIRIQQAIDRFPKTRRPELWCGMGMACSYAGGVNDNALLELEKLSGSYRTDFLSGIPFSAHMRQKGENPSAWTDRACQLLLNMTADHASTLIGEYIDDITNGWKGTEKKMWEMGYTLVRQRLKVRFRIAKGKTISLDTAAHIEH